MLETISLRDNKATRIIEALERDRNDGKAFYGKLVGISRVYKIPENDFLDILQETYYDLIRYGNSFRGNLSEPVRLTDPTLVKYLCKIFVSNIHSYFQRKKPRTNQQLKDSSLDAMDLVVDQRRIFGFEDFEYMGLVREAVDDLAPIYRESVKMFYFKGLCLRDIAQTLEIPVGTVKRRLHVGRKKLKDKLVEVLASN
jgi:RNA polymerase sigma factor (sigma-70 family)